MNWEAVGEIGEIVGAVAVIVTLAYLAIQIRQNSNLARATIRENRLDSSHKVLFAMSDASEVFVKLRLNEELTPSESLKVEFIFRAMFRDFEGYAYQRHSGFLEDSEWEPMMQTWRDTLVNEATIRCWNNYKQQYSKVLHEYMDEIIRECP
ncbi:MAG: hypothetical protein ACI9LY_003709 [Arenicella sp.]|jgi:hypothetical protein